MIEEINNLDKRLKIEDEKLDIKNKRDELIEECKQYFEEKFSKLKLEELEKKQVKELTQEFTPDNLDQLKISFLKTFFKISKNESNDLIFEIENSDFDIALKQFDQSVKSINE